MRSLKNLNKIILFGSSFKDLNLNISNNLNMEGKKEWYLEIPKINLKAEIAEGTTKEIMDEYIGHFEETQKLDGNVGLAAHNRGYKNNYFSNIKNLSKGDVIYYKFNNNTKEYQVISNSIIEDTNWSNLENTEDNRITLITCVENKPNYRRCIQGKEINT